MENLEIISDIYTGIEAGFREYTQSGLKAWKLAFDSIEKRGQIRGKKLDTFETLNKTFYTYGHTALLDYFDPKNVKREHIDPDFKSESIDISEFLAEYFNISINIIALIDKKYHAMLEKIFGKEWRHAVCATFSAIEIESYHNSGKWNGAKAHSDTAGQVKHAFAPGLFGKVALALEAKKMAAEDYKPTGPMLCSEFVARRIVLTIPLFNEKIKQLSEKSEAIARFPFGERADLSSVSPSGLRSALEKSGCLEPVDLSKEMAAMGLSAT